MRSLPEPLRVTLRAFCHVEWVEVPELRDLIKDGRMNVDVGLLEDQMNQMLDSGELPVEEINNLTSNEFESTEEAAEWLTRIRNVVFRDEPWS